MKKILVPIDYSKNSKNALMYALVFAKKVAADIVIYHSLEIETFYGVEEATPLPYVAETLKQNNVDAQNLLDDFLEDFKSENDIDELNISGYLDNGDVVLNLNTYCKENKIDLIVMGTKGVSGLSEIIFGTVTANVIKGVNAPVLVVPENAQFKDYEKIIYASDFEINETASINYLLNLSEYFEGSITCLHINTDPEKYFKEDCRMFDLEKAYRFAKMSRLNFELIEDSNVEESLNDYFTNSRADILAIKPKSYGFIQGLFHTSLTEKLAYHTNFPLLIVRD